MFKKRKTKKENKIYPKDKFYFLHYNGSKKEPLEGELYINLEKYPCILNPFRQKFVVYKLKNNKWEEIDVL